MAEYLRRSLLCLGVVAMLSAAPTSASADPYRPQLAGHPLRIAGYILHPVGFVLDTLIFRPAHWLGSQEPFQSIFGHQGED